MNDTSAIGGTWFHSYEEDTQGVAVYRPKGFAFPPSRGRPGIEFGENGSYVEISPGADDRGALSRGQWRDLGAGEIEVSLPEGRQARCTLHVLSCQDGVLRIAK